MTCFSLVWGRCLSQQLVLGEALSISFLRAAEDILVHSLVVLGMPEAVPLWVAVLVEPVSVKAQDSPKRNVDEGCVEPRRPLVNLWKEVFGAALVRLSKDELARVKKTKSSFPVVWFAKIP